MAKRKPKATAEASAGPQTTVTVRCPRFDSFRVQQVAGMFDLQPAAESVETFNVEIPARDEPWQIGCIVGPSGSGKSSVARQAFGQELYAGREWPAARAVVDCFEPPDRSIKEITGMLTAVGFSSPPSWVKPYAVLSNGEKFRCDLARALLETDGGLVVFDEFTSVVDRTVAKIGSAAVAKAIRRLATTKFVAVTCHYDVVEWLAPDWVLDMQSQTLARGSLQRPGIAIEIRKADRSLWSTFARHHYLSHSLPGGARFYVACVDGQPAALCVVGAHFGACRLEHPFRGVRTISRIVTLPDFQGVGIGGALLDAVAELLANEGLQARITTSHPGMIARLRHAPGWRVTAFKLGSNRRRVSAKAIASGLRRVQDGRTIRNAGLRYTLSARFSPATAAP